MAAPTLVVSDEGTGVADTDVSLANVAVGDLVVIIVADQEASAALTTTIGGSAASPTWNVDVNPSNGTQREYFNSTVATSAGTWVVSVSPYATGNNRRIAGMVFRHANGFPADGTARLFSSGTHTSVTTNSYLVASLTDCTRPCVAVAGQYSPGTTSALSTDSLWDAGASTTPLMGGGTGNTNRPTIFDYKAYDTGASGESWQVGAGGNNVHAAALVVYQTNPAIAAGLASETDEAFAITINRTYTVGLATETDEALTIHLPLTALGLAEETDSAFPIGFYKAFPVGMASETDEAFAISQPLHFRFAEETDEAFQIVATKLREAEIALANPGNGPITYATLRVYAWKNSVTDAGDIRIALKQGASQVAISDWVALTDSPTAVELAITSGLSGLTDLRAWWQVRTTTNLVANVSDVELELGNVLGLTSETDTSFQLVPQGVHNITIGIAEETDTAFAAIPTRVITVGIATETDTAFAISFRRTHTIRPHTGRPHLVWLTKQPHTVWSASQPVGTWEIILMTLQLHELTIEPIFCEVDTKLPDGSEIDPTGDVVEMALTADGADPDVGDWVTGDWITNATTGKHYARTYFGPFATKGVRSLFLRVTDDPAVPVKKVGIVEVI